jgi:O-antigen ligase
VIASLLLMVALVFAAWSYGGVEPWALQWVQMLALLGVAALLLEARLRRQAEDAPASQDAQPFFDWRWAAPLLALAAFVGVQALNASHLYTPGDEGLWPRPHLAWLPRSVSRGVSVESLLLLLTYAAIMAGCRAACPLRGRRLFFLGALLLSGSCMAVLVLMQRYVNPDPPRVMTGMFVNENNYAAYANLLMPVALWLGRGFQRRAAVRLDRSHPGHLLYLAAGLLAASVLVSGSRSGILVTLGLFALWVTDELAHRRREGMPLDVPRLLALAAPLAAAALVFFAYSGGRLGADLKSLDGLAPALHGRLAVIDGMGRMFRDRWACGTGAGTFAAAFPYYQPRELTGLYFRYAHNDWLQYAVELGLAGTALLAALVAGSLWPALSRTRQRWIRHAEGHGAAAESGRHSSHRGEPRQGSILASHERRGLLAALAGISLHALIDFPIHIPAVAALAAAWVGLAGCPAQRGNNHAAR